MLEDRLNQDLKRAMLAGDKFTTETLRTLKSAILYVKVSSGERDHALSDEDVVTLLRKEARKRQEAADLYVQGGSEEKAQKELSELKLIERYLPALMQADELALLIDKTILDKGGRENAKFGEVIQAVKQQAGSGADGGTIARLVKERLG